LIGAGTAALAALCLFELAARAVQRKFVRPR